MFLAIFNYMLAHVPGFMRPGVSWLLNGLRSITNYIGDRWNSLGRMVSQWWQRVALWAATVRRFTGRLSQFALWLVRVRIPAVVAVAVNSVLATVSVWIQAARNFASGLVAGVRAWASDALNWLAARLSELRDFARSWIDRIRVAVNDLIRALRHVLQGPDVLAQWLVAAMWRASMRFVRAQQDRIALWLTRESAAFTRWLAREIEDIILRWL